MSETSVGLYAENKTQWAPWLRSILGLRGDMVWASDAASDPALSSQIAAFIPSPKAGLIFGPFAATEITLNAGLGFHSNDVRG